MSLGLALGAVILGLGLLYIGAEVLLKGAVGLAKRLGVSPFVIGLTIVALGTSAPEWFAGVGAVLKGQPDINMGNVVGSNIANILLILGATAVVCPIPTITRYVKREVPIVIAVAVVGFLMMLDREISRVDGLLLLLMLGTFLYWSYRQSRVDAELLAMEIAASDKPVVIKGPGAVFAGVAFTIVGVVVLSVGAEVMVNGAVELAREFGVSEQVIGKTLVAFGTSVPELATSLVAALRKQPDIAVGNVLGSNIFNITLVLGTTSLIDPLPVQDVVLFMDMPVVLVASMACVPIMLIGRCISRWEGILLLAGYLVYIGVSFVR